MKKLKSALVLFLASLLTLILTSCMMGAVVGTAVDTTLEVAKVPFKVAGAAIEIAASEDDEDD